MQRQKEGIEHPLAKTGHLLVALAAIASLAGCGPDQGETEGGASPYPTAATLGPQAPRPAASYLAEEPFASASEELGNRLLLQCRACHTLEQDGPQMLGPNLYGVFGREAGSLENYGFTAALREAKFVWTPRALDAWLAMPAQFLPGNAMAYGGIPYAEDRAALIASLLRQTSEVGEQ